MESTHTLKSYFNFKADPNLVFEIMRNTTKTDSLFSSVRSPTRLIVGMNTFSIGNKFEIEINQVKIEFEVLDHACLKDQKHIKWKLLIGADLYFITIQVYKCCVTSTTTVETIFKYTPNSNFSPNKIINDNKEYMTRLQDFVKNVNTSSLSAVTSVFRVDRSNLLKLALDLTLIKNYQKYFGNVKYLESSSKIGSRISFGMPFIGFDCQFIVFQLELNSKLKKWEYKIRIIGDPGPLSITEMWISIFRVRSKKCVLEVTNVFKDNLNPKKAERIKLKLQCFLKDIYSTLDEGKTKTK